MGTAAPLVASAGVAPAVMTSGAPVQLDAQATSAVVGSLDQLMDIVPKLQQLGERLRGPKARVILMDAGLVRAFDALCQVNSLADVRKALEQLDL
jgi:hypothetical protein